MAGGTGVLGGQRGHLAHAVGDNWKKNDASLPSSLYQNKFQVDQRSKCKKIKTTEGVEDLSVFIVLRVEKAFLTMRGIQKLSWNAGIFVNIKIINVCKKKKARRQITKNIFTHHIYISDLQKQ